MGFRASVLVPPVFCIFIILSLTSCGTQSQPTDSVQSRQERTLQQLLYVAGPQTVSTYSIDPTSGAATAVSTGVQVAPTSYAAFGPVDVQASSDDRFLYIIWVDSTANKHLSVFATDGHGSPQTPALQTIDIPSTAGLIVGQTGRFAYEVLPTYDTTSQKGNAKIHAWSVNTDGTLSDTGTELNDPQYVFGNLYLYGVSADGKSLYTAADVSMDGFTSIYYLQHAIDSATGTLSPSSVLYSVGWEWGDLSRTAIGSKYVATFYDGLDQRVPAMTYIDVRPLQDTSKEAVHCTNQMSDACLNAGDLEFDRSGDFLFVTDVITKRMRVLRIDASAGVLRDTGSSIAFSGSALPLYFSPDDSLVYSIEDARVQVLKFDVSSGSLAPVGTSIAFPVPYALVSSIRD